MWKIVYIAGDQTFTRREDGPSMASARLLAEALGTAVTVRRRRVLATEPPIISQITLARVRPPRGTRRPT